MCGQRTLQTRGRTRCCWRWGNERAGRFVFVVGMLIIWWTSDARAALVNKWCVVIVKK